MEKLKLLTPEEDSKTIPEKYRGIYTDKTEIFNKMIEERGSYFLYGGPGTGKTVLAYSVMRWCLTNGANVKMINYPAFLIGMRRGFSEGKDAYGYADELARFNGLLIIDDLGAEKATDFVREITYYIINERDVHIRKVLITSNYDLEEIDNQIDRRLSSRIVGMCKVIKFDGEDRRI